MGFCLMGNPNTQLWQYRQIRSLSNSEVTYHPFHVARTTSNVMVDNCILAERTEIHKIRVTPTRQRSAVSPVEIFWERNNIPWYLFRFVHSGGPLDPPIEVDLSNTVSNTLGLNPPDPPLIMDAGETFTFRIDEPFRTGQNFSDYKVTIWGVKIPT